MLTGHGQYADPVSQSKISLHAYFQQLFNRAFKALKLNNFVQQAAETFPEFLTCVTNAAKRHIPSVLTKNILIKQITWEELNIVTCNVITPIKNEDILRWVLAASDIDTQNGPISVLMASINALVNTKLDKDDNFALQN